MIVYLDTSSIVKLYVEETNSKKIRGIVADAVIIATSMVAYVEARAAFARKQKENGFSITALRRIVETLNREWERNIFLQ